MDLLTSNIPPIINFADDFESVFKDLIQESDRINIASGYISTGSLTEIKKIIEINGKPELQLLIGMHHFEGFTRTQFEASKLLDNFLRSNDLGQVAVSTVFKFHGKVYSFCKNGTPFAGVIGSSNLNNIIDTHRSFEVDLLVDDKSTLNKINSFINEVYTKAGRPFKDYTVERFNERNPLLEGHYLVKKPTQAEQSETWLSRKDLRFELPIKITPHSNLNVYFGKGREDKRGFVMPRHWYEVELIVPKAITSDPNYPKAGGENVITVYTDDGWKFDCKISGDYSKNFRSTGDLKILGKWIKGRLENNGCLKLEEPVTDEVLKCYGRNTLELIATNNPKVWFLNFGVKT